MNSETAGRQQFDFDTREDLIDKLLRLQERNLELQNDVYHIEFSNDTELLNEFAGRAMQSHLLFKLKENDNYLSSDLKKWFAQESFEIAEAMLLESKKHNKIKE